MRNRGISLLWASLLLLSLVPIYQCGQQEVTPTDTRDPAQIAAEQAPAKGEAFTPYDKAPEPVGGLAALQKKIVYPEIVRRAGIQGTAIVNVLIDASGKILETKTQMSSGNEALDLAAIAAIEGVSWKPAEKDRKPIKTWITVPIKFKLHNEKKPEKAGEKQ